MTKCKNCNQEITLKKIKEEAKEHNNRTKAIYKDYAICKTSGYCIKCLRNYKELTTKQKITEQKIKKQIKKHKKQIQKGLKKEEEIKKKLKKQGLTKTEITEYIKKFKSWSK